MPDMTDVLLRELAALKQRVSRLETLEQVIYAIANHDHTGDAGDGGALAAGAITSGTFHLDRIPTPLTGKDADTVDGAHKAGLMALAAVGQSATNFTLSTSGGAWGTDTNLTVTITPAVTSTLLVVMLWQFQNSVARAIVIKGGVILDDSTQAGQTENIGAAAVNTTAQGSTLCSYTGVSAAAHTIKPQFGRAAAADSDTTVVTERFILVIAIPE